MKEVNEAYDRLTNPDKYAHQQAQQNPYSQYTNPYSQYGQQSQSGGNPYGQQTYTWGSPFGFGFEEAFGFGGGSASAHMPQIQTYDSQEIRLVIQYYQAGRVQEALNLLMNIPSGQRNARWYYLSGLANHRMGNTIRGTEHMTKAVQMDPGNPTYQQLLRQYQQAEQTYSQNAQGFNMGATSMTGLCTSLCLMNLLCGRCGFFPICCC